MMKIFGTKYQIKFIKKKININQNSFALVFQRDTEGKGKISPNCLKDQINLKIVKELNLENPSR